MSKSSKKSNKKNNKKAGTVSGMQSGFGEKICSIWLMLILAVHPLILTKKYSNVLETKYMTFAVLTGIMIVLVAAFEWESISGFFKNMDYNDKFLMIFIIIAAISTLTAYPYSFQAFLGNEGRYTGLFLLLIYTGAYICAKDHLVLKPLHIYIFMASTGIMSILGIADYFRIDPFGLKDGMIVEYYSAFTSTIGNINTYTTYVAFLTAISGMIFIEERDRIKAAVYYAVLIISFTALIMGHSDNAYLSLMGFFGFVPFIAWKSRCGFRRYMLTASGLLSVFKLIDIINIRYAGIVIGMEGIYPKIMEFKQFDILLLSVCAFTLVLYAFDYGTKANEKALPVLLRYIWGGAIAIFALVIIWALYIANTKPESAESIFGGYSYYLVFNDAWGSLRGYIWKACIEEYLKLPLVMKFVGTGPNTFGIYMVGLRYNDMIQKTSMIFDTAHNEYLEYLFTVGPIATVSYILLLCGSVWKAVKKNSVYLNAAAVLIVCYSLQATVNISLPISTPILWVFIAAANGRKVKS